MRITRRHLQVGLGALWLLDGVLQCQPIMFSRAFAAPHPRPVGRWVSRSLSRIPCMRSVRLGSAQPALANGAFALIQILLGLATLHPTLHSRRTRRVDRLGALGLGRGRRTWRDRARARHCSPGRPAPRCSTR